MIMGAEDGGAALRVSPGDATDEWNFSLYHLEQTESPAGPRKKQLIPATLGPDRWPSLSATPWGGGVKEGKGGGAVRMES